MTIELTALPPTWNAADLIAPETAAIVAAGLSATHCELARLGERLLYAHFAWQLYRNRDPFSRETGAWLRCKVRLEQQYSHLWEVAHVNVLRV